MTLAIPHYIVWQDVPGDLALCDVESVSYHALNGTAAAIWREIARGASEAAVIDALAAAYDVPRAAMADDVADSVADELTKGLLVRSPI